MPPDIKDASSKPRIGIALGSGSARGWGHIGILRELAALGIRPDVVCGSSIGALVGAAYAAGHLDTLEQWARKLTRADIIRYLDINLLVRGGFAEANRLIDYFRGQIGDRPIDELSLPFAAVATDLVTGEEVWLRQGLVLDVVRAAITLPGLLTPVQHEERWLVDGGLVNPVPVSLCRAMGADAVIAVNLNGDIVGKRISGLTRPVDDDVRAKAEATLLDKWSKQLRQQADSLMDRLWSNNNGAPGLFDVLVGSLHIMQDQITRTRMAEDAPELALTPRLADIGLLEFDKAERSIAEGRDCVREARTELQQLMQRVGTTDGESD